MGNAINSHIAWGSFNWLASMVFVGDNNLVVIVVYGVILFFFRLRSIGRH